VTGEAWCLYKSGEIDLCVIQLYVLEVVFFVWRVKDSRGRGYYFLYSVFFKDFFLNKNLL